MKIRSLLLGSAAVATVAGFASVGYAADLGVVTSLDVCNDLNLTGLAISSDDNCLVISGGVTMEFKWGNYDAGVNYMQFAYDTSKFYTVDDDTGALDSNSDIDVWLKFVATAGTDFGPASATIKLVSNDNTGAAPGTIGLKEAWVGVGDTTMLMAGYKDSIFNKGDDAPLNYLGLFNSESVNTGVGFSAGAGAKTGGAVVQVVSSLGNGLSVAGGVENLGAGPGFGALVSGVGVLSYAGDGLTAHGSLAVDGNSDWRAHAGFTGSWDPIKVVAAISANSDAGLGIYWDALGSISATFDMFTLAGSTEATSEGEWGYGASASAKVTDMVTLNLGGRFFHGTVAAGDVYQVEAGLSAAVTETLTLTGAVGVKSTTYGGAKTDYYGNAGVAWAPGGGLTTSLSGELNSDGAYKATFKAAKTIK